MGNPQIGNIAEEDLKDFWLDYLNTPQPLNHNRTISDYWEIQLPQGSCKVELDAYGPYRMDGKEFHMVYNEFGQQVNMPPGYSGNEDRKRLVNH